MGGWGEGVEGGGGGGHFGGGGEGCWRVVCCGCYIGLLSSLESTVEVEIGVEGKVSLVSIYMNRGLVKLYSPLYRLLQRDLLLVPGFAGLDIVIFGFPSLLENG